MAHTVSTPHEVEKDSRLDLVLISLKRAWTRYRIWLNSGITLVLLVFLVSKLWEQLHTFAFKISNPGYLALAIVCVISAILLSAELWGVFLPVEHRPGFFRLLGMYIISMFWNIFLPGGVGGDMVRAVSLSRYIKRSDQAIGSILMARIASLWGVVLLAAGSAVIFGARTSWINLWIPAVSAAGLGLTFLMTLAVLGFPVPGALKRFQWINKINQLQLSYRKPRLLATALLIAIMIQGLSIVINACAAAALGLDISVAQLFFAMPLINLITSLPVSLGGLGLREGSYYFLLNQVGVVPVDAVILSLCVYGLIVLVTASWTGLFALVSLPVFSHQRVQHALHLIQGVLKPWRSTVLPQDVILYLTDRCNARCGHCFYRACVDQKTSQDRLDFFALEKLAESLKRRESYRLHSLVLTGGEPFLRTDLVDISVMFWEHTAVEMLFLPTNGFLTDRIIRDVGEICARIGSQVYVQVSLDGLEEMHDSIRSVEGAFTRAIQTAQLLKVLQVKHPNLYITFSTTLSKFNVDQLEPLSEYVANQLKIPQSFELVRGTHFEGYTNLPPELSLDHHPPDPRMFPLPVAELPNLCSRLDRIFQNHARLAAGNQPLLAPFIYAFRSRRFWHLAEVLRNRRGFRCPAGSHIGIIYPNGDVALCEFTKPVGNLFDMDLAAAWNGPTATQLRSQIKGCYCSSGCFQSVAMLREARTPLWLLRSAFEYQWRRWMVR